MFPSLPFLSLSRAGAGWRSHSARRRRSRAATGRLEAAVCGFERSIVALRTAALDHVDSQDLACLTLRVFLERRGGSRTS